MRILFRNLSQVEFFLKISKKTSANNLIAPDGGRLPTQRVHNAFCRGYCYNFYDELKLIMGRRQESDNSFPSLDDMHRGFSKGFYLALAVAEEYGFQLPEPADTLSHRLAGEGL